MKEMKWELVSSQYLFKDGWLTARRDRCRMPDGRIVDPYYVMEYPDWVNAVALTKEGKILMVVQYRHALGKVSPELPGGCIDPEDENPEEAVRRELLEETGYLFRKFTPLGVISANPSTNNNLTHLFLAEEGDKIQGQTLDPNEDIEVQAYTPEEIMQLLTDNKIMQSLHVSGLFYAFRYLKLLSFQGNKQDSIKNE